MKVGLFFGSFNPIHIGHLAMANYLAEFTDLGQIWMVVSPQSPFKKKENLLPEDQRYKMVEMALEEDIQIRPSDIEFNLPRPSYTVDTLDYLSQNHPGHQFCLIVGSDNLVHLHEWKNYHTLVDRFELYVYPRPGTDPQDFKQRYAFHLVNAPRIEISSSMIRHSIREGKNMRYFLPSNVYQYIKEMDFYEK
ncbi:MAG TPA: nicotinate (nicotinamide) nucleotide adenylyltransferase [Bacteroidales bacterium]|nr:nicotinate (nicotinamide) nucleotide adenylyltransferase [Bacteroidales bacterium]